MSWKCKENIDQWLVNYNIVWWIVFNHRLIKSELYQYIFQNKATIDLPKWGMNQVKNIWFPAVYLSPFWTHFWSLRNKYLSCIMDFLSNNSCSAVVLSHKRPSSNTENIIFKTIYCSEAALVIVISYIQQ